MPDTDRDAPETSDAPRHLSPESRQLWRELQDAYELESWELKTLRLALEALDRATQARRALRRLGTVYTDRFDQPRARPEVAIERDATQAWLRLMGALALPVEDDDALPQPRTLRGQFGRTPRGQGRVAIAKAAS